MEQDQRVPLQSLFTQAKIILAIIQQHTRCVIDINHVRTQQVFLACCDVRPETGWQATKSFGTDITTGHFPRSKDIITFINGHLQVNISKGSYDGVRKKFLQPLCIAGVVINGVPGCPDAPTNDSRRGYGLDDGLLDIVRSYNESEKWRILAVGVVSHWTPRNRIQAPSTIEIPTLNLRIGPGTHNEIQKAVIEQFLPRFAPNARVIYMGEAQKSGLICDEDTLRGLNITRQALKHNKCPDIIAYDDADATLYVIEVFHSQNPFTERRLANISNSLLGQCMCTKKFVTAFANRASFAKECKDIAWRTQVWCADCPEHIIIFA